MKNIMTKQEYKKLEKDVLYRVKKENENEARNHLTVIAYSVEAFDGLRKLNLLED